MLIKTYKKTATIQAMHWTGDYTSTVAAIEWGASYGVEIEEVSSDDQGRIFNQKKLRVPTLEGPIFASRGDFIAKGVSNEFWPIKPDIMGKTYQEV